MQSRKLNKDREHFEGTKQMLRIGILVQPFLDNIFILYPLKTPENERFLFFFRRYEMKNWPEIG